MIITRKSLFNWLNACALLLLFIGASAHAATQVVNYGPFTLAANTHGAFYPFNVEKPCENCWITGISPNVVYADDSTANYDTGIMMHHMVMFNVSGQDLTCPDGVGGGALNGERLFAAGNERTALDLSGGNGFAFHGYKIDTGDLWLLNADIVNHAGADQTVYIQVTWNYSTSAKDEVVPVWLDIDNCADSQYPTAGGYEDIHWSWTSNISGKIVSAGGHVHDGGISIATVNATTGANICTSVAGYGAGSSFAPGLGTGADVNHPVSHNSIVPGEPAYLGHIEDMTQCGSLSGVGNIAVGDVIDLHTQYNGTGDPGDMGIVMLWVDPAP